MSLFLIREGAGVQKKIITSFLFSASADTVFLAVIDQPDFPISNAEVITWNTALINPGGCYDTLTGAYTAPVHGYYFFTVQKESDNYYATFNFVKEGVRVAHNAFYDQDIHSPVSTSSIILELETGERVQVENTASTFVYGTVENTYYRSWFSGFLLYSL